MMPKHIRKKAASFQRTILPMKPKPIRMKAIFELIMLRMKPKLSPAE
jgi:hypothetical protein